MRDATPVRVVGRSLSGSFAFGGQNVEHSHTIQYCCSVFVNIIILFENFKIRASTDTSNA